MKTLISENGAYKVYAEISNYSRSEGNSNLKFFTVWEDAKDPTGEQVKFQMILSPEERQRLKEIL